MKRFPKVLYVERYKEGTDNEVLIAREDYQDAAVVGERVIVGVYELRETMTVVGKVELV